MDEVLFAAGLGVGNASADPGFAAHAGPIGAWAEAVWRRFLDLRSLHLLVARAKVRLCKATRTWAVVNGPAAAMLATASRLGWEVKGACEVADDVGRVISFVEDSPAAVRDYVRQSVERWRMRRLGAATGARSEDVEGTEVRSLEAAVKTQTYPWWSAER